MARERPKRKAGRPKMHPAARKQVISRKLSPDLIAFLKSIPTVDLEDILRESKDYQEWTERWRDEKWPIDD